MAALEKIAEWRQQLPRLDSLNTRLLQGRDTPYPSSDGVGFLVFPICSAIPHFST